MLKKTVTYEDFDGNRQTETLYFNLSKTDIADNLEVKDELQNIKDLFEGVQRELTTPEIKLILDFVKKMMRLSYGIRSEDGKRFKKSLELWQDLTETALYDSFLFSLFANPEEAVKFLTGVMPSDLIAQAEEQMAHDTPAMDLSIPDNAPPKNELQLTDEELEQILAARRGNPTA